MAEEQKQSGIVGKIVKLIVIVVLIGVIFHFARKAVSNRAAFGDLKAAQALIDEQKYDAAIAALDKPAYLNGHYGNVVRGDLGRCWEGKGVGAMEKKDHKTAVENLRKALKYYKQTTESKPDQVRVLGMILDMQYEDKDRNAIIATADEILKLEPGNGKAKNYKTAAEKRLGPLAPAKRSQ